VTLEERMARAVIVKTETQRARERLAVAPRTMDYTRALQFQKGGDRLERETRQLRRSRRCGYRVKDQSAERQRRPSARRRDPVPGHSGMG
jgi:hypothetical protein